MHVAILIELSAPESNRVRNFLISEKFRKIPKSEPASLCLNLLVIEAVGDLVTLIAKRVEKKDELVNLLILP